MIQHVLNGQMSIETASLSAKIVDFDGNGVSGWAIAKPHWWSRPKIVVRASGKQIGFATAGQFDPALKRQFPATDGKLSFFIKYDIAARRAIKASTGDISVFVCTSAGETLLLAYQVDTGSRSAESGFHPGIIELLRKHLALFQSSRVDRPGTTVSSAEHHPSALFHRLAEPRQLFQTNTPHRQPWLSAFMNFALLSVPRSKGLMEPQSLRSGLSHLLIIAKFAAKGLKIPLCLDEIDFLNAIDTQNGADTLPLTRFSRQVLSQHDISSEFKKDQKIEWFQAVFRYCTVLARKYKVEDCLVPAVFIKALSETPPETIGFAYPISHFAAQLRYNLEALQVLDPRSAEDRCALTCAILVLCSDRPDCFRYLAQDGVRQVFEVDDEGTTDFGRFLSAITGDDALRDFSYSDYRKVLLNLGFDVADHRFTTITPRGDRIAPAALALPASTETTDIQFIGPLTDNTGLGLASRLEAEILTAADANPNIVDLSYSDATRLRTEDLRLPLSGLKRAKINIIHHNADNLPLVLAASPDVFTDAYNIGYFAWELDSPAECHFLALELLDEIWVQSDYNVHSFAGHCDVPVINAGMSFEPPPEIDRTNARRHINEVYGFTDADKIFLTVFDALSDVRRKNPLAVVQSFLAAFGSDPNAKLLIKSKNASRVWEPNQKKLLHDILSLARSDNRIRFVDKSLNYHSLMEMVKASDCYVSLHRSEGWGFGMIEAMALEVPVLCTGYSGNMEFCTQDTAWLVDYSLVELDVNDFIFVSRGQKWAEPDVAHASSLMRFICQNPSDVSRKARYAKEFVAHRFSVPAVAERVRTRLSEVRRLQMNRRPRGQGKPERPQQIAELNAKAQMHQET